VCLFFVFTYFVTNSGAECLRFGLWRIDALAPVVLCENLVHRISVYGYGYIREYPPKICGYGYGWKIWYQRQA